MTDVEIVVRAFLPGQGSQIVAYPGRRLVGWSSARVAVHHACQTLFLEFAEHPPHLPVRYVQQCAGLLFRDFTGCSSAQNLRPALLLVVQSDCPHTQEYADNFPEQLTRTYSLSNYTLQKTSVAPKLKCPILSKVKMS